LDAAFYRLTAFGTPLAQTLIGSRKEDVPVRAKLLELGASGVEGIHAH
jgi:hypothetical protein